MKRPSRSDLEALLRAHVSPQRVAVAVGTSTSTVYRWIDLHGLRRLAGLPMVSFTGRAELLAGVRSQVSFRCPEMLWTELKVIAARCGCAIGAVVVRCVASALEQNGKMGNASVRDQEKMGNANVRHPNFPQSSTAERRLLGMHEACDAAVREKFLEGQKVQVTFTCPRELWAEVKVVAARTGCPAGEVVLSALLACPTVAEHLRAEAGRPRTSTPEV